MALFGLFKSSAEKAIQEDEARYVRSFVKAHERMREIQDRFLSTYPLPIDPLALNDTQRADLNDLTRAHQRALQDLLRAYMHAASDATAYQLLLDKAHLAAAGMTADQVHAQWMRELDADFAMLSPHVVTNAALEKAKKMDREHPVMKQAA